MEVKQGGGNRHTIRYFESWQHRSSRRKSRVSAPRSLAVAAAQIR